MSEVCALCIIFHIFVGNSRPTLKDLWDLVVTKVAHKWKDLGLQLLQPDQANMLNVIEANHPHDVESCCKRVLEKWLDTSSSTDATWNQLIGALKSPSVQLDYVANELKQNMMVTPTHCKSSIFQHVAYVHAYTSQM